MIIVLMSLAGFSIMNLYIAKQTYFRVSCPVLMVVFKECRQTENLMDLSI
jgi:hypothetical protein